MRAKKPRGTGRVLDRKVLITKLVPAGELPLLSDLSAQIGLGISWAARSDMGYHMRA
jgi:hypothetical protein